MMTPEEEAAAIRAREERRDKIRAMTMGEFLERREKLARKLYKELSQFEWDTGVEVKAVNLLRHDTFGERALNLDYVLLVTEVP